jgi:hypothetical protein
MPVKLKQDSEDTIEIGTEKMSITDVSIFYASGHLHMLSGQCRVAA